MSDYFTYIIRSNSKDTAGDNTNSCTIRLGNLPQHFKTFECQVVGLYISNQGATFNTSIVELRAENLSIQNGADTQFSSNMKSIAFSNTLLYIESSIVFQVENFNNKSIKFQLYDENNLLLSNGANPYNKPWFAIIKMRGIN